MSPISKDNKIELGASSFGTNTSPFPCTYTEEKMVIQSHERPFLSTYNTGDKKDPITHLQNKDLTLPIA